MKKFTLFLSFFLFSGIQAQDLMDAIYNNDLNEVVLMLNNNNFSPQVVTQYRVMADEAVRLSRERFVARESGILRFIPTISFCNFSAVIGCTILSAYIFKSPQIATVTFLVALYAGFKDTGKGPEKRYIKAMQIRNCIMMYGLE